MGSPADVLALQTLYAEGLDSPAKRRHMAHLLNVDGTANEALIADGVLVPLLAASRGQSYYADADASLLIESAAAALPSDTSLTAELLPQPSGLWLFAQPAYGDVGRSSIAAFGWLRMEGDRLAVVFLAAPQRGDTPVPTGMLAWEIGSAVTDVVSVGTLDTPNPTENEGLSGARLVLAALLFIAQEVVVTGQQALSRAERRRYEREHPGKEPPPITVVTLPRRRYERHEAGERQVAWQSRWAVSGHWRKQPYPASGTVRPRYINPYIKGPQDRPLRVKAKTLYAVKAPPTA